jgi:hypothetical protein
MENLDLIMTLALKRLRVRPTHIYYYPSVVEDNPDFKDFDSKEICGIKIDWEEGRFPGKIEKNCPFLAGWMGVPYPVYDLFIFPQYFSEAFDRIKNASPAEVRYLRLEYL